jgi:hypothetical protein
VMRSFCSVLNMPDSYSFARPSGLELTRSNAVFASLAGAGPCRPGMEGTGSDRPALTLAIVNARKEQVMRDEREHKVETAVEARAGFLDRSRAGGSVR